MCGRYILAEDPERIYRRYKIGKSSPNQQLKLDPMYNIAPGFLVPVITRDSPNKLELMKWGLVPHWAKDPKIGYRMINARAETLAVKPSFRSSFQDKRCLVPTTGFFEWKRTPEGKIPYLIQLKSQEVFSFAGIYDIWKDAEGKKIKTFTIITTEPNKLVENIHNRMPAILSKDHEDAWLENSTPPKQLLEMLVPYCNGLETFTVSREVNNPKNQDSNLLKQVNY